MPLLKRPLWTVEYSTSRVVGTLDCVLTERTILIERVIKIVGLPVWYTYWVQFPNKQVVKLSKVLDGNSINKLLQKL